jgi:hypothetical protein
MYTRNIVARTLLVAANSVNPMPNARKVFYSAFGLSFGSNVAIPGLVASEMRDAAPDVEILLGTRPLEVEVHAGAPEELYYVSVDTDEQGEPGFRIWRTAAGQSLRMDYADGVRFWFDRRGARVWCTWPANLTIADAAVYLLGPVLGLLLRLRGVTCVHASAAAFGDYAVAFAGPPGAGKSTTVAALGRRGHPIISDDIVAVEKRDGRFFVFPAHPYLGLWPESVEMLYGGKKKIPGFASIWDKGRLSLSDHNLKFQERALPLGAVFLLEERTSDPAAPSVENLPGPDGLMKLLANSYGTHLLEKDMRAREFELLGELVARVPVWQLRPHADREKLAALCDLIERSCGRIGAAG